MLTFHLLMGIWVISTTGYYEQLGFFEHWRYF